MLRIALQTLDGKNEKKKKIVLKKWHHQGELDRFYILLDCSRPQPCRIGFPLLVVNSIGIAFTTVKFLRSLVFVFFVCFQVNLFISLVDSLLIFAYLFISMIQHVCS